MMNISVVTSLYQSSPYIRQFYDKLTKSILSTLSDYEIIFVNDGSPDDSLALVLQLQQEDSRVKVVDLSRNFGHHQAMMAGIAQAKGDCVCLIDCDLEESPESLAVLYEEYCRGGEELDMVYGVQRSRKGGWFEQISGRVFFSLLNHKAPVRITENLLTIRVMSRRYVNALLQYCESELYLGGVFSLVGFKQKAIAVEKSYRGVTSYSLSKRVELMVNAMTSFSSLPLRWIFYSGFSIASASFVGGIYLVLRKFMYDDMIDAGWTSLIVSIWFIGGLLLLAVGAIGIYIAKIFNEVKHRPNYLVRKVYDEQSSQCQKK